MYAKFHIDESTGFCLVEAWKLHGPTGKLSRS
jgi:hypothetical protein